MSSAPDQAGLQRKAVVIGSGVIGTSCAYFLQKSGWQPTVIDRGGFAAACSQGNCGLVCPSHVLPLAEPGAIQAAIRAMFSSNAAFRIRPRLDLALWIWLWNFARRCSSAHMLAAGHQIQALLESSLHLYEELIQTEHLDCEWQKNGLLFAYLSEKPMQAYAETNDMLAEVFHEPAQRLDGDAVRELEPALRPGLAGGWYYPNDAHLRPDKLMSSWRSVLEQRGARFIENCEFREFERDASGQIVAVRTSTGRIAGDVYVVATGALTPLLEQHLGCKTPIQPGKGYSLTMPRPAVCPRIPLIFPEHRVAVTPMQSGYRLGSIMEFAGYDSSISPQRLELLRSGASHYLQDPYTEPVLQEWYGWRPMTYDSLPMIDRAPVASNVFVAAGHNMLGLSMAPATGKLIAELVTGTGTHVDPTPYRVARFS